jgi:hypothetical protein
MSIALGISIAFILACLYTISKINNDKKILEKELIENSMIKPSENEVIKEDFLKFISDSREWAFDYIEEVQLALTNFKTKVDPEINYFDKYGEILSNQRADYQLLKRISEAYKDLIKILPQEENTNV